MPRTLATFLRAHCMYKTRVMFVSSRRKISKQKDDDEDKGTEIKDGNMRGQKGNTGNAAQNVRNYFVVTLMILDCGLRVQE